MELYLYVGLLMVVILIFRYVLGSVFDRGVNEIGNAIKRKQNEENPDNTDDLANRYRR